MKGCIFDGHHRPLTSRNTLHTANPPLTVPLAQASSSPIQRTVTSLDQFEVSQDITFKPEDPRVDQIVKFGDAGTCQGALLLLKLMPTTHILQL
eukprot:4554800-Pyramimonas_sp.AAC.2